MTSIDIKKRIYRNELNDKIKQMTKNVERCNETMYRLKRTGEDMSAAQICFNEKQIDKIKVRLNENEINIQDAEDELQFTYSADFDEKIEAIYKNDTEMVVTKTAISANIKKEKRAADEKNKGVSMSYYQITRKTDYENRRREKDYRYQYKRLGYIAESLPPYMQRNLKTMPANKGYIWRGCQFFGKGRIDRRNSSTILFEKKKGNILVIHDIGKTVYKIYEKQGKGERLLVQSTKRRKIIGAL